MSQTKMKFAAKKEAITDQDIENIITSFDRKTFRNLSYLTINYGSITDTQVAKLAPHLSTGMLQRLKLSFKEISSDSTQLILKNVAQNPNLSTVNINLGDKAYVKKDLAAFLAQVSATSVETPPTEVDSLIDSFGQFFTDVQKDLSDAKNTITGAIEGFKDTFGDINDIGNNALNAFSHAKTLMASCLPNRDYTDGADKRASEFNSSPSHPKPKLKTA